MARVWLMALLAVFAAGCDSEWQTKRIDGLMPPLEFELRSDGAPALTADRFRGQIVLLAFGFMSCPDVCPSTLARLAAARRSLPAETAQKVAILFVSVDPQRDTAEALHRYAANFGPGVHAATGSPAQLRALARRYRTTFSYGRPDGDGFYDVSHPAGVYVFDRTGSASLLIRQNDAIDAIRGDLLRLVNEE